MGDKGKKENLIIGILREQIHLEMLKPFEVSYAVGLISYFDARGSLTEKQVDAGWKMVIRTIQQRSPDFDRIAF